MWIRDTLLVASFDHELMVPARSRTVPAQRTKLLDQHKSLDVCAGSTPTRQTISVINIFEPGQVAVAILDLETCPVNNNLFEDGQGLDDAPLARPHAREAFDRRQPLAVDLLDPCVSHSQFRVPLDLVHVDICDARPCAGGGTYR